ncbi:MAG: hypothetical protein WDA60_16300 [Acidimicrobiia bacterium]
MAAVRHKPTAPAVMPGSLVTAGQVELLTWHRRRGSGTMRSAPRPHPTERRGLEVP